MSMSLLDLAGWVRRCLYENTITKDLTLMAFALLPHKAAHPQALMKPHIKGER